MITTIALTAWGIACAAVLVTNHRARQAAPAAPPPPDPDATADDDDSVSFPSQPPPVPAPRCRFEADLSCPLDLQGFELDAAFYAVLAPSFKEYQ